jgi:hypothetical protein
MVGGHAITGSEDICQICSHLASDGDGSFGSKLRTGGGGQLGVWSNTDHHQNEVGEMGGLSGFASCSDFESTGRTFLRSFDPPYLCRTLQRDAVFNQLTMNQSAEFGVNGRKYFWQLFDLSNTESPDT